jgi:hypothetical protein
MVFFDDNQNMQLSYGRGDASGLEMAGGQIGGLPDATPRHPVTLRFHSQGSQYNKLQGILDFKEIVFPLPT